MVSNLGGRQLDGVLSSAKALPSIADAVKNDLKIFDRQFCILLTSESDVSY